MMNEIHYVYYHIDPRTDEIVYVGHGSYERAWVCRTTGPGRSIEHATWCKELMGAGYTPQDWVRIHIWSLSKDKAKKLEAIKIKEDAPRFNQSMGAPKKLDPDQIKEAEYLRDDAGWMYNEIAEKLGVSTMTVWRAIN
jgi:hypothetical protein